MNTQTTLKNALFSFFHVGVMPPHSARYEYEAPRVVSAGALKPLRP